jgi:hypothetical protein
MLGLPIALVGMALVATAFDVNFLLASPQSADIQNAGIRMGDGPIPFGTATFLGFLFFVLGVAVINTGVAVRLLGRPSDK